MTKPALTILAVVFAAMVLVSCRNPLPERTAEIPLVINTAPESRFYVEQLATFADPVGYRGTRAIYLIRDRATEQEFIGVSGIGISELGSHKEGHPKQRRTVADER